MKLEKTASGAKKLTISKAEWLHIGRQAEWTNEGSENQIYVEIELNKTVLPKRLPIPSGFDKSDSTKLKNYIRSYFSEMGYDVGNIKVL